MMDEDRLDQVSDHRARHRADGAGVEVGHQGDPLLPVERARNGVTGGCDQRAQLGGRAWHLDLEILYERNLAREAHQERRRQRDAAQRRILQHDWNACGFGDGRELDEDARLIRLQQRAVVGRHQHKHCGSRLRGGTPAFDGDARAVMAARDNHRNPSGHVRQAELEQCLALGVSQKELLGKVCEDADAVDALINHAVKHAAHAVEVEITIVMEGHRRDRENSTVGLGLCHYGQTATWRSLVLLGATWCYVVLLGATWCYLVLLGATWRSLVLLGALETARLVYVARFVGGPSWPLAEWPGAHNLRNRFDSLLGNYQIFRRFALLNPINEYGQHIDVGWRAGADVVDSGRGVKARKSAHAGNAQLRLHPFKIRDAGEGALGVVRHVFEHDKLAPVHRKSRQVGSEE